MTKAGITLARTAVGDRYLLERMSADGYNFGGEQSGHFIFRDYATTGDGILTGLQLLQVMRSTGKRLSELASVMQRFPQTLVNIEVPNKELVMNSPVLAEAIAQAEKLVTGIGRVNVRPSGTESLVRVMVELQDEVRMHEIAGEIVMTIKRIAGLTDS